MYLKRYRSSDVRDALRVARQELGSEALVLSKELVPVPGWRGWIGQREIELTVGAERGPSAGRHRDPRVHDDAAPQTAAEELAARLMAGGLDRVLAREVASDLPAGGRRGASLLSLRDALAGRLSELASTDDGFARVEVFVGPPGVGKTTTIAKLASQERARHGQKLSLIAADGFRIGAVEQLRMYADIIGAPFTVARTADDLADALSAGRRQQPILVDTAGRPVSDAQTRDLFRLIGGRKDVRTHLVLAADTPVSTARRVFDAYEEARPTRLVLTKLDEAGSLSPLVGLLRERQLPISYLGTGQRVPDDLNRATAQLLAASVIGEPKAFPQLHS
jgi:flagellar biosynthesis protein FlhF